MERSRVALVIPALNEAESIGKVVMSAAAYGKPIVVDDGSSDATAEVARAAGAEVTTHAKNRGYDAALDTGFRRAFELGYEWVVTLDADGQHDPRILETFLRELETGADVVVGIRDRRQRFAEAVFAWFGSRAWKLSDPLCGMKGYRMSVYAEHGCFDSCRSIGTELAVSAAVRNKDVRQVSVATRPRPGTSRFGGLRGNIRILRALLVVVARAHVFGWRVPHDRDAR